jgi:DNA-binding transcriptional LysR family regulator
VLFGPGPALLRSVHALYPSRRNLPAKVRSFLDALAPLVDPLPLLDTTRRRVR